jgi:hypothetical protein
MSKNKIFLVLPATAAFSYLFYKQSPGLNHAVFSYTMVALFALSDFSLLKNKTWISAALVCLTAGTLCGINGTGLNLISNFFSFLLLAYVSSFHRLSVITGIFYAGISALSGLFIALVVRLTKQEPVTNGENEKAKSFKWYYWLLPVFVLFVFFILYRESSGAFKHLTDFIDLSFFSANWLFFTFAGFMFIFGLFIKPAEFDFIHKEAAFTNEMADSPRWKTNGFIITGILLFFMLDFLLTCVNVSDIIYLSCIDIGQMDMTYAELIHQGMGSLALSLILAVGFILLWINQQNTEHSLMRKLKLASKVWVGLNLVLIGTNIYKNILYINAYGLTYLRIGVYFFLFMTFLTLVFCAIKIIRHKNNFYMYRRFGLLVCSLVVFFNCFNWGKIITNYNIELYKTGKIAPDASYLMDLGSDCLPTILANWETLNPSQQPGLNKELDFRCQRFLREFELKNWRSLTLDNYGTYEKIKNYTPVSDYLYNENDYPSRFRNKNEF